MSGEETSHGGVQSVRRALALLEHLSAAGGEATLSELARSSGLPQPTIHRLVQTLVACGYVRQRPSRRYVLTPRLAMLAQGAGQLLPLWAQPHLAEVVRALGETANLALLDGDAAVYVAQVPAERSLRMFTEVGRRVHLHSTGVGKALLAQLEDDEVLRVVARAGMPEETERTITSPDKLLVEVRRVRRVGYAVDDGEQEAGVRCYAVPVPGGAVPMAVSVSGPETRMRNTGAARNAQILEHAARSLAAELDARPLRGAPPP
jgi:IclR family acetate operon transcriptional repressor